jgi:transposase
MSGTDNNILNELAIQKLLKQKDQRIAAQEAELIVVKEQLTWLKRQIFGAKSERIVADLDTQPLLLDFDFGNKGQEKEPEKQEIHYNRNKPSKNRGSDTISFPDDLPVERIVLDLPEEEKVCSETGQPLVRIGDEVSRKLARRAEQFFIIEYVRPKYVSKAAPDLGVKTRLMPYAVIPRCPADESLLAYVLTSKYADHLPLNRLVEIMKRSDVAISRQTLSKWVLTLGSALSPTYDAMRAHVLSSGVAFVDESPVDLPGQRKEHLPAGLHVDLCRWWRWRSTLQVF